MTQVLPPLILFQTQEILCKLYIYEGEKIKKKLLYEQSFNNSAVGTQLEVLFPLLS